MNLSRNNFTCTPSSPLNASHDEGLSQKEEESKDIVRFSKPESFPFKRMRAAVPGPSPSQWMAYFVLSSTALFAGIYAWSFLHSAEVAQHSAPILALRISQLIVEIGASFYGFAAIFTSIAYLLIRERKHEGAEFFDPPPAIGILYLCCDDIDHAALESLLHLEYRGKVFLIVHDDSQSTASQAEVNRAVERLRSATHFDIRLLRRPKREGGKAGAVNYLLEQTGDLYSYFLLCDNDTTILDPLSIEKALTHFKSPEVAIVQCRSVAFDTLEYCSANRLLCRSIDVFHLFMTVCSRFGWRLFIGHNALLRTDAVLRVGGLTPGFFSDDLDLTIRLNLAGYSVEYAPSVRIGEKHPPNYDAFRSRTYKWSYGCMQMLRTHAWTIITKRRFSLAEKVSFFYFAAFYVGQSVLLFYLAVSFLIAPFYLEDSWSNITRNIVVGSILVVLVYLPIIVFFLKNRELRTSLRAIVMCGLVYGTTDFACVAGVWDCLRGKKRRWVPTNAVNQKSNNTELMMEAALGLLLLSVPLFAFPRMLYLPCAYVFVGKFLFGPTISLLYRDGGDPQNTLAQQEEAA